MTIETGVGFAVALWALIRTFTNREGSQAAYIIDLVVCVVLAVFIVKGVFS